MPQWVLCHNGFCFSWLVAGMPAAVQSKGLGEQASAGQEGHRSGDIVHVQAAVGGSPPPAGGIHKGMRGGLGCIAAAPGKKGVLRG